MHRRARPSAGASVSRNGPHRVFLVERMGKAFERPIPVRYIIPPGAGPVFVRRGKNGEPLAIFVEASSSEEALRLYIASALAQP